MPMRLPRMLPHLLGRQIVDALAVEQDLAAGDAAGRLEQADDRRAGDRFAGAGFADHAQHLARRDVEGDDRRSRVSAPRRVGNLDPAGCGRESAAVIASFGLSASRSQSPSRLTASTSSASVMPGKIAIHHSPENRKSLPMRISVPSEGCVGGRPTPRNDSVASVMMASARLMVAITSTGPSTLGRTCRNMIRAGRSPISRAASTYSLLLLDQRRAAHGARILHPDGEADATAPAPRTTISSCASRRQCRAPRRRSGGRSGSPGRSAARRRRA